MKGLCEICEEFKTITYFEHLNICLCIDCEDLPLRAEVSE